MLDTWTSIWDSAVHCLKQGRIFSLRSGSHLQHWSSWLCPLRYCGIINTGSYGALHQAHCTLLSWF